MKQRNMQNNILLPNSNVAPLSGMARGSESSGAVRRASAHNIPENDPHFQDSTFKKGFMKLGQKMGIVEKVSHQTLPFDPTSYDVSQKNLPNAWT